MCSSGFYIILSLENSYYKSTIYIESMDSYFFKTKGQR